MEIDRRTPEWTQRLICTPLLRLNKETLKTGLPATRAPRNLPCTRLYCALSFMEGPQQALFDAAAINSCDVIDMLFCTSRQLDVNSVRPGDGWTALHEAAAAGNTSACRCLIGWGASVSAKNAAGELPLHLCAARGHVETVACLLATTPCASSQSSGSGALAEQLSTAPQVLESSRHSGCLVDATNSQVSFERPFMNQIGGRSIDFVYRDLRRFISPPVLDTRTQFRHSWLRGVTTKSRCSHDGPLSHIIMTLFFLTGSGWRNSPRPRRRRRPRSRCSPVARSMRDCVCRRPLVPS